MSVRSNYSKQYAEHDDYMRLQSRRALEKMREVLKVPEPVRSPLEIKIELLEQRLAEKDAAIAERDRLIAELKSEPLARNPHAGKCMAMDEAQKAGFSWKVFTAPCRIQSVVHARQRAWHRMRTELWLTLYQIGKIFDRDHATVRAGIIAHCKRNNLPYPATPDHGEG